MNIKINHKKDIAILNISGEIDINSSALIEVVGKLLKKGIKNMVMDLSNVEFVDYNGLSVLAIAYKNVLNNKGIIKLSHIPVQVMELLRIVKLDSVFSIYRNTDRAVQSFKTGLKPAAGIEEPDDEHPLRRRFKRLGMDITIYYKKTDAQDKKEAVLHSGLAGNISGAGLFLRGIDLLPIGTKIDLDIVIPETKKCISAKGIIIWIADKQLQPDFYPGMGIQFLDISQKTQEDIINFVEKHIAK